MTDLMKYQYLCTAVTLLVASLLVIAFASYYRHKKVMAKALSKAELRWKSSDMKLEDMSTEETDEILDKTATQLLEALKRGDLSSVKIVSVYIKRCIEHGRLHNAITEEFFDEALRAAAESDLRRSMGTEPRLLEGIPISVKDCFDQVGADSTCGLASHVNNPKGKDCPALHMLRQAGAIPLVRSNVPPILMAWETSNNVFGSTKNPWNVSRIVGGSSGGEGALIASRSSVLGIGTDIGGSLRIPASCCGLYSLKPTTRRVTTAGVGCQEVPGQTAILSSPGPMGRCVDDLELVMKVWGARPLDMWRLDPYRAPVQWRTLKQLPSLQGGEDMLTRPRVLRVGYFTSNQFFPPSSCCVRAVHEAVDVLKAFSLSGKGVEVEVMPWNPPGLMQGALLANKIFTADGCSWLRSELRGEWAHESVLGGLVLGSLPSAISRGVAQLLKLSNATYRLGILLESSFGRPCDSVSDTWRLNVEVEEFRNRVMESFRHNGLDAVICPTMGLPAVEHGNSTHLLPVVTYTSVFNVLEWPAGNVPVTHVAADECEYAPQEVTCPVDCDEALKSDILLSNKLFRRDVMAQLAHKQMKDAVGLPVGVSVAAPPYCDELVLDIMRILEMKFPFKPAC